eukprot:521899_1
MSKVPIIAKNTSVKKHFNLWFKAYKYHAKLRRIYDIVSERQKFNLMKRMFIEFRDYIYNEKRKRFLMKRLILCKYIQFWLKQSKKQRDMNEKQMVLSGKYNGNIEMKTFKHWKYLFRDCLVSFHLNEFKMNYCVKYYLQIWRNINMKRKIKMFNDEQLRYKMIKYVNKWKGFVVMNNKIFEIESMAIKYYTMKIFNNVWQIWKQKLFDKYILMDGRHILKVFHVKYLLNKWRNCTQSKQICTRAHGILCDYKRKRKLFCVFNDWNNFCIAKRQYKISLIRYGYIEWRCVYNEMLNEKYKINMTR